MNPKFELERWERHWRICRLHGAGHLEHEFGFSGKNVLELGCGPVLGLGPFTLFHGAERFWYREPDLVRTALESTQVKNKYFVPAYEELVSNYGRKQSFDDWYARSIELSQPLPLGAERLVDITVSNSVLEHIPHAELLEALRDLHLASRCGSSFSHTVDFGPHGGKLSDIYARDRGNKPRQLNLLRKSEIERLFVQAGFALSAAVVYKADPIQKDSVHETWRTYSVEDLTTRVMIFIGGRVEDVRERKTIARGAA